MGFMCFFSCEALGWTQPCGDDTGSLPGRNNLSRLRIPLGSEHAGRLSILFSRVLWEERFMLCGTLAIWRCCQSGVVDACSG